MRAFLLVLALLASSAFAADFYSFKNMYVLRNSSNSTNGTDIDVHGTGGDIFNFTKGFLEGLLESDYSEIEECIDDAVDLFEVIKDAIEGLIKNFSWANVLKAVAEIAAAVPKFISGFSTCSAGTKIVIDFVKMVIGLNWGTILLTLGKNLLFHGISIVSEIIKFIKDLTTKDWYNAGKNIGLALHHLFLGS